jgi:hypothetical protein
MTDKDRRSEKTKGEQDPRRNGLPAAAGGGLGPSREDANADAIEVFPRERYEEARDGKISARELARDMVQHAVAQIPPRRSRAGGVASRRVAGD